MHRSSSITSLRLSDTLTGPMLTSTITQDQNNDHFSKFNRGRKAIIPTRNNPLRSASSADKDRQLTVLPHEQNALEQFSSTSGHHENTKIIDNLQIAQPLPDSSPKRAYNVLPKHENSPQEHSDDNNSFDVFVLKNFKPFSGIQKVTQWLDEVENLFSQFKISRSLRYEAIPLLVEGEAKRKYIRNRRAIHTFDDFYEFMLSEFDTTSTLTTSATNHQPLLSETNTAPAPLASSFDTSKSHAPSFDVSESIESQKSNPSNTNTFARGHNATSQSGEASATANTLFVPTSSVTSFDSVTNDLRRAIVQNLIKNPKIFHGGKDDVQKWIEDIDHLMEIAHVPDINRLDLISYSLRGDALQWYKTNKSTFKSWNIFVSEINKAFTSSFREELAFKTLESYTQAENQSVRNFFHEVLKLCKEADSKMSESTKLKNLLNKVKPNIQFEVRKRRPTTTAQFLEYAKEVEELLQLSSSTSNMTLPNNPTINDFSHNPSTNVPSGYSRPSQSNQYNKPHYSYQYNFAPLPSTTRNNFPP